MRNGWTGGQYSLARRYLASLLTVWFSTIAMLSWILTYGYGHALVTLPEQRERLDP